MGWRKDHASATKLVHEIRDDEAMPMVSYDEDDINQAIKHTREDVVLISSLQLSLLKQLHAIRYLLIAILVVLVIGLGIL